MPGAGRLLDHLLVAALQRTVALEQVHDVAVAIGEHLHLDMARAWRRISPAARGRRRSLGGLAPAGRQRGGEILAARSTLRMPLPPPPATALISTG